MGREGELLALRKDVLVARSSLLRLKAASEIQALRESLTCREIAGTITTSPTLRTALFGSVLLMAGTRRLGRLLRMAAVGVALAKAVTMFASLRRN